VTFLGRVPIRIRLTLAFAVVMAIVLGATGAFVYLRQRSDLDSAIDRNLSSKAGDVAALVRSDDQALRQSGSSPLTERGETFAQVVTPAGRVFDSTPQLSSRVPLTREELRRARQTRIVLDRVSGRGLQEPARLLATPVRAQGRQLIVVAGAWLGDRDEALDGLAAPLLIGGPIALLLASLAGYGVAASALRPVEAMRRKAAKVSVTEPGATLPVPPARDEVARLGKTLNEMLARQEVACARERTFVGDASHELRTPLAILRTELELALRTGRSAEELEAALRSAAEETDRLGQLAEDLLVIARSDQGRLPVQVTSVDANALLDLVRGRFARRAKEQSRTLRVEADHDIRLVADPLRLEQALGNLVENALRHGKGAITLSIEEGEGSVELHVRDEGRGFADEFLAVAFERFTRGDPARSRGGGAGLGLPIVQAIANAHGGSATAGNRPGGGADVWVALPQAVALPIAVSSSPHFGFLSSAPFQHLRIEEDTK
jgi:signal transduction histidine kinase